MQKFPIHTKDEWLLRAIKELPEGKSFGDLMVKNNLYTHDGLPFSSSTIDEGALFGNPWRITAEIADLDNTTCLSALANGANCLYFTIAQDTDVVTLLQEIRLDYITSIFNFNACDNSKINYFKNILSDRYTVQDLDLFTFGVKDVCNTIQFKTDGLESIESMTDLMKKVIATISMEDENILIEYNLSTDYYNEIAKLRALKILVANVKAALKKENNVVAMGRPNIDDTDFNHNLIRWSFESTAAVIGNVDFLSLHPWHKDNLNEARLAQNIQHLLREESSLDLYNDVMAGSYFIEDVTQQIVTQVWQNIVAEL
jgi:Methylmalonyl-CoA mutase